MSGESTVQGLDMPPDRLPPGAARADSARCTG
jgi:hypothetical protein